MKQPQYDIFYQLGTMGRGRTVTEKGFPQVIRTFLKSKKIKRVCITKRPIEK